MGIRWKVAAALGAAVAVLGSAGPASAACTEEQYERLVTESVPITETVPGPIVTQIVQVLEGEWQTSTVQEPRTGYTQVERVGPYTYTYPVTVQEPVLRSVPYTVEEAYVVPVTTSRWVPETYTYTVEVPYTYTVQVRKTRTKQVPVYRTKFYHLNFYSNGNTYCEKWDVPVTWCPEGTGRYGGHVSSSYRVQVGTRTETTTYYVDETRNGTRLESRTGTRYVKVDTTTYETRYRTVTRYRQVTDWVSVTRMQTATAYGTYIENVPYTYYVDVPVTSWVEYWVDKEVQVQTYLTVPTGEYEDISYTVWDTRMVDCEVNPA